jgi:hypothetical protein
MVLLYRKMDLKIRDSREILSLARNRLKSVQLRGGVMVSWHASFEIPPTLPRIFIDIPVPELAGDNDVEASLATNFILDAHDIGQQLVTSNVVKLQYS